MPTEPFSTEPAPDPAESEGIEFGGGVLGPARGIKLTIYPREGTRASLEIEVRDWRPKPGASNEFILDAPVLRTRTKDGHAVRVTARQGVLEARRRRGGSLDPQRGRLTGGVVIEYDRLTAEQRQALGGETADSIDPADLIRMEMEEIEFDYEYSTLVVPDELHVSARDFNLRVVGLEVRLNEAAGRIDSLRVRAGGRLELLGTGERLGLSLPGLGSQGEQRLTLFEWVRSAVEAQWAKASAPREPMPAPKPEPADRGISKEVVTMSDEGIPVFRVGAKESGSARTPVHYHARFEGNVDVRQWADGEVRVRVQGDALEIMREFGTGERDQVASPQGGSAAADRPKRDGAPDERIVLEWTDRLFVTVQDPNDERTIEQMRPKMIVEGSPVTIVHTEGEATCARALFFLDDSNIRLEGNEQNPVWVRTMDRGVVTGRSLLWQRNGEELFVRVTGPGSMMRNPPTPSPADRESDGTDAVESSQASPAPGNAAPLQRVEFAGALEAYGRKVHTTTASLDGWITSREEWILERAWLTGAVRAQEGDALLLADDLKLTFATRRVWAGRESTLERLEAAGNVELVQARDRLSCRELNIEFARDPTGHARLKTATAIGDVVAQQGQRKISARDRLVVDFEEIDPTASATAGLQGLALAGSPSFDRSAQPQSEKPSTETRNQGNEATNRKKIVAKRFHAFGDVSVVDPDQNLALSAHELRCDLLDEGAIDDIRVTGRDGQPASIQLDTLTIVGRDIRLNVPGQSAEVPGDGRLTFLSFKDLNGQKLREPVPITVTWNEWMRYRGKEDRAVFSGDVRAASATGDATFNCDQLVVEFAEAVIKTREDPPSKGWERFRDILQPYRNTLEAFLAQSVFEKPFSEPRPLGSGSVSGAKTAPFGARRGSKELTYLLATGHAVAVTSQTDPKTGKLLRRTRIVGPKLSVSLRPDVSKMLIEGPGSLQLEEFRVADTSSPDAGQQSQGGLFKIDASDGPSKTLIQWQTAMWYDFSIDQTRFEGRVRLKHFSGAQLAKLFNRSGSPNPAQSAGQLGRSTFLTCDTLTVDFADREARSRQSRKQRLGRISAPSLRRFQADGSVVLQDSSEGLALWADRLVYEQARDILAIYGSPLRKARIITKKPGKLPSQMTVDRLIYNLTTGEAELLNPLATGR
ncbi:MAG: hypothetical protein IIC01_03705 [Planctomycetes bacterium]|nr:hypothetical protein [Planctomycetota bacterium]